MKIKSLIAVALMVTSMSTFAVDTTFASIELLQAIKATVGLVFCPFAGTSAIIGPTSEANKEQLAAVRADAVDYLAGADASETLKASIKEIKTRNANLKKMSDAQIVGLIVTALE